MSLMAYDLHGSWEKTTGHNSPLYKRQGESGAAAEFNVVRGRREEAGLPHRPCPMASLNLEALTGELENHGEACVSVSCSFGLLCHAPAEGKACFCAAYWLILGTANQFNDIKQTSDLLGGCL